MGKFKGLRRKENRDEEESYDDGHVHVHVRHDVPYGLTSFFAPDLSFLYLWIIRQGDRTNALFLCACLI